MSDATAPDPKISGESRPVENLRALSLWQPWASLISLGVKRIETRSWSTKYRGPLLIHAAIRPPKMVDGRTGMVVGDYEAWPADPPSRPHPNHPDGRPARLYPNEGRIARMASWWPLPLGAAVATCDLVDVLPIVAEETSTKDFPAPRCVGLDDEGILRLWTRFEIASEVGYWGDGCYHDQGPYGDFTPGRFAWLLDNVHALDPVPMKGKQGLWTASLGIGHTGGRTPDPSGG